MDNLKHWDKNTVHPWDVHMEEAELNIKKKDDRSPGVWKSMDLLSNNFYLSRLNSLLWGINGL